MSVSRLRVMVTELIAENLTLKGPGLRPDRRYSEEVKRVLLNTVTRTHKQGGQPLSWILAELGLTCYVYHDWPRRGKNGDLANCIVVPRSALAALLQEIEATIAKTRARDRYQRLARMTVDEHIVFLAPSTVYRILDRHDLLYPWKVPELDRGRRVPEATYPNEAWPIDLIYLWVKGRWHFLATILDSYSRYIVHWELPLSVRAEEIAEITATALKRLLGRKPRVVRENSSQFAAEERCEVVRYFEVEEIFNRVRHPESNRSIEHYHHSVRKEAFDDTDVEDLYRAREPLTKWGRYYNEERLHSLLEYLRPVDYYLGNPQALLVSKRPEYEKQPLGERR